MAGQKGQTRVDGLEKIDLALDAVVKYLMKRPTMTGLIVLSSNIKKEIQWENKRLKTYMDEQSIRNSDRLTIEHLKREMESRNSKVNYLKDKLTNIMTTCRGLFKSEITAVKTCYNELTKLKHINERFTHFENEREAQLSAIKSNIYRIKSRIGTTKMTERLHFERGVKTVLPEQRGQQTLNYEEAKNTEYKSNIISVIQHLEKGIECRDLQIKQLEEDLNKMKDTVYHLEHKLKDKDSQIRKTCQQLNIKTQEEQVLKQSDQLQRVSNQLFDFETDQTKTIKSLKKENQEKDKNISKLSYQLKEGVRYNAKDDERESHFEKLSNRKLAEIDQMNERIDFLNQNMKKKESQVHVLREQLDRNLERQRETETESDEIKTSLEQKIQNLVTVIKRNQHVKDLEENLRKRTERDAENKRIEQNIIAKETARDKDNQISQLRYQQQHTFKKWQTREAELNEYIMTLEKKKEQYKEKLKDTQIKMTQISDRNALLEMRLKETDEQSDQRDHTLEKLQTFKDDLLGSGVDLKKKYLALELELSLKDKDLGNVLNRMTQLKDEKTLLVKRLEESDRDQREQLQQANLKFHEREVEMNNIIISLKKEQEEKNHLKLELKYQREQTMKKMNEKEADMTEINTALNRKQKYLEAEMDRREQKVKHLDELLDGRKTEVTKLTERNELLEKKLKEMDDRLHEQKEQQRIKTQHLQKDVEQRDRKVSSLNDMLQNKQKDNMENEEENVVSGKVQKTSELDEQLEKTFREVHDTEVELDDTKTMPVKAIGDILTGINPINTDLSDRNRPTKLAERCTQLYDNQWTDSFEILAKYFDTEENVIKNLLKILQDAMTFCKTRARTQMEELGRELTFAEQHAQGNGDMLADVRKLFNDCKRIMAPVAVGNLNKRYASRLKRSTDKTLRSALEISSYTSECLEICWLMVIHDPPVVFAPVVRKGSSFNTDLYKPYTTSGTHIDYVVWPPVLLHEGGPILAKGVAQGYSNVQQCRSAMYRK